jgi:hypothetical protein
MLMGTIGLEPDDLKRILLSKPCHYTKLRITPFSGLPKKNPDLMMARVSALPA